MVVPGAGLLARVLPLPALRTALPRSRSPTPRSLRSGLSNDRKRLPEKFVAKLTEFKDGERRIVFVGDNEIGVFRHEGDFYAYSNFCLHQGGPACEGLTIAKVEERLRPIRLRWAWTSLRTSCISCAPGTA